ncbi:hypothetical protein B0H66DRAFT_641951 [Apodospora peruviana]|uniref:Rhodopsin domain-containing protein n=1 Tax=Apodospora peruviana TaxID=516989 RepID=A0AAE0M1G8_9PEZI|nr:hypothetical protein B0H66DRAFT_641951 [Apodospora peruviana]
MSVATPVTRSPSDEGGRGPMIMGIIWTAMSLALIAVTARIRIRLKKKGLLWDDWFMIAAVVLQLVNMSAISVAYHHGMGKHDRDLTFEQNITILKWSWIQMIPGACATILARISAAILLHRLFHVYTWFGRFLVFYTPLQTICCLVVIFVTWLQVTPIEGLWNPKAAVTHWDHRIAQYAAYLAQSLFTISDLTFVLFPTIIIWGLNMTLKRRLGLIILLSVSLLTAAASILKTLVVQKLSSQTPEPQYTSNLAILFSNLEQISVILMGCVPPLRAAVVEFVSSGWGRLRYSSFTSSFRRYGSKTTGESTTGDRCSAGADFYNLKNAHLRLGGGRRLHDVERGQIGDSLGFCTITTEVYRHPIKSDYEGKDGSDDSSSGSSSPVLELGNEMTATVLYPVPPRKVLLKEGRGLM